MSATESAHWLGCARDSICNERLAMHAAMNYDRDR